MKLLLIPWGRGMGHLTRCLAVAAEAVRHDEAQVSIVAEDRWAKLIEQVGCKREKFPQELISLSPWNQWEKAQYVRQSLAADLHILETVKPDVVLHDVRWSMLIACELANITCVTLVQYNMYPGFLFPEEGRPTFWDDKLPAFNEVLSENGLEPLNSDLRELFFRYPVLIPSIPEFDALPIEAQGTQMWYTGPLLFNSNTDQSVSILSKKSDVPTIFVYGVIQTQEDLNRLLTAFQDAPFHLLITALPPNVCFRERANALPQVTVSPFVDATAVLPNCAAAIIHGGHGSCLALLSSGTPAIVLPDLHHREQIYNSKLLEKMGIARCLLEKDRWDKVLNATEIVIQDSQYHVNAVTWQEHLRRWTGAKTAWKILTKLL